MPLISGRKQHMCVQGKIQIVPPCCIQGVPPHVASAAVKAQDALSLRAIYEESVGPNKQKDAGKCFSVDASASVSVKSLQAELPNQLMDLNQASPSSHPCQPQQPSGSGCRGPTSQGAGSPVTQMCWQPLCCTRGVEKCCASWLLCF